MMLINEHFIYFTEKTYLLTLLYICLFYFIIIIFFFNKKGGFKCYAVISRDVLGLCLPRNLAGNADASRMYLGKVG